MGKAFLFLKLYCFAVFKALQGRGSAPEGIHGSLVTQFVDPHRQETGVHGVVAFVLPLGHSQKQYTKNLWGAFGFSKFISLNGRHLYGVDTWGTADKAQIQHNVRLRDLAAQHPGQTIQLAGVRRLGNRHIWPLNRPHYFILARL